MYLLLPIVRDFNQYLTWITSFVLENNPMSEEPLLSKGRFETRAQTQNISDF